MSKTLNISFAILLLFTFLFATMPLNSSAINNSMVRNVDTGLSYTSIQEAINADSTLDGHTIQVGPGTYYEQIIIHKSISLVGKDRVNTIIDGGGSAHVIHITAKNVRVEGFTVRNSKLGYSGIYVHRANGINISQNIFENNYHGIYLHDSSGNFIFDNVLSRNEYGIRLYNSSNNKVSSNNASENKNGIHLDISNNNILNGNSVSSNSWNGIYLYGSANNTLLGNLASSNQGRGIRLHNSSNNTLSNNTLSKNAYGIHLYSSSNNTLIENVISFNNVSGICLQTSSQNLVYDNDVLSNMHGICLINSDYNILAGNNISSNSMFGLRVDNSSRNWIFHNNFVNNLVKNVEQPTPTSFANKWDNNFEGNFWSDYDGIDENMDGVGDTPYQVDERKWLGIHSQDNYPLMGQLLKFSVAVESQRYTVPVVTNSTILRFQYLLSPENKIDWISLYINNTEGVGFCRITIPHILVAPPYTIIIDGEIHPYRMISTNGTHTWIYFTHSHLQREVSITRKITEAKIWLQWWFWGMAGSVSASFVLLFFNIRYRRIIAEQKMVIQSYGPFKIAQRLFENDVRRRRTKIRNFEMKYGVRIQPRNTLEDIIKSLETEEKKRKAKD